MSGVLVEAERIAVLMAWFGAFFALAMAAAVVTERIAYACRLFYGRRIEERYGPKVRSALEGDAAAQDALVASPAWLRVVIGRLLIAPLIDDRDPERIARTRAIARSMAVLSTADRYLRSHWWWRRALGLRALGLVQDRRYTPALVAALDDEHEEVRAAALDALADMQDPASLQALVVRMHDPSLHRGRWAAALTAFGGSCEPFLLELADVDPAHRRSYARALAVCGTSQARRTLCRWAAEDPRMDVRAAAFEALGHIGLDEHAAPIAIDALDSSDVTVRAMAAYSLHDWQGTGDAAARLARHLDDSWPVAVNAAHSLRTMPTGVGALAASAQRPDLAGMLARQMLWEVGPAS